VLKNFKGVRPAGECDEWKGFELLGGVKGKRGLSILAGSPSQVPPLSPEPLEPLALFAFLKAINETLLLLMCPFSKLF